MREYLLTHGTATTGFQRSDSDETIKECKAMGYDKVKQCFHNSLIA